MLRFRNSRAWFFFAAAWIPYAASFYVIFRYQANHFAFVESILNVLPAAVLGALLFRVWNWGPESPERLLVFLTIHFVLCCGYAFSWVLITQLLLALLTGLVDHQWRLPGGSIYAFQWALFAGVMTYLTLAGLRYMLVAQDRAETEHQKRMEAEALRARAELAALRAQLNPHFLFNTLHSVAALVSVDSKKAESALIEFAEMLRYALASHTPADEDEVSLEQEIKFADAYLALEGLGSGSI